ncbi:histidine phosphatase family protein [Castellaniella sp. WN]
MSSPALRCAVLAHALSGRLGLAVETDEDCREMDFGTWEGRSWDAIGRAAVDAWAAGSAHHAPGGGAIVMLKL